MSIPVPLERLAEEVARFGSHPYLLTTGDDDRPRANHWTVEMTEGRLEGDVGRRTRANAAARPLVCILWPPCEPAGYNLIVDGEADVDGERLVVTPTWAVLHRPAEPTGGACQPDAPG